MNTDNSARLNIGAYLSLVELFDSLLLSSCSCLSSSCKTTGMCVLKLLSGRGTSIMFGDCIILSASTYGISKGIFCVIVEHLVGLL